ncbi:GGDEF domain-containing protein [Sphingomonas sp. ASV193]|uniref:GGDEF domain-containing protein n=1 Tax=Sphingomonas sp. ASV193 TaxID=3144405 RepID=UPI0032E8D6EB
MSVDVDFYAVVAILFGALGVLAVIGHQFARRHVALVWLAAGLIGGTVATVVFRDGGTGRAAFLLLALFEPFALFTISLAMRLVVGAGRQGNILIAAAASLIGLSLLLIATGVTTPVLQCVPFEIAGLLIVLDVLVAVVRRRRGWPERAMIAGLVVHAATHVVRFPYYPSLLDGGHAFPSAASPWLNLLLLTTSSFYVPLLVFGTIARDLGGHIDTLRETSKRDGLTGLLTRLAFEQAVDDEPVRHGSLVVCDLDHFKAINDSFGHPAGDVALRRFAQLCAAAAPVSGRMGGEEFALLLPGKSLVEAQALAEQIRRTYASATLPEVDRTRLTASFGVASYRASDSFRDIAVRADRALYRAKQQGRDCVTLFGTAANERDPPVRHSA